MRMPRFTKISPLVSGIVPKRLARNVTLSPGAAVIVAWRKEPAPESLRFVTCQCVAGPTSTAPTSVPMPPTAFGTPGLSYVRA